MGFANDPAAQAYLQRIADFAAEAAGRHGRRPPEQNPQQISQNGQIAFVQLDFTDRSFTDLQDLGRRSWTSATQQQPPAGVQVEYGGDPFAKFELPESEILGVIAAVIILIVAFGSVLAMGLPIGIALFGLGIASPSSGCSATSCRCPTSRSRWSP